MFVFLETDGFAKKFNEEASLAKFDLKPTDPEKGKPNSTVRRPYRGIQIKEDTYASLSVIRANGEPIRLTSSSAKVENKDQKKGLVDDYSDFILQGITDRRSEKQQVIETFGEPFIYFFGERPRIVHFRGMLVNTEDFNWRAQFWHNYEEHLRGTKLVQENARVYLTYDTILLEGYPIDAQAHDMADAPYSVPFEMQMFLTNYHDFSFIGQTRFPGSLEIPNTEVLNSALQDQRSKFVSTTAAVRRKNIESRGPKGILAELRRGIRGVNNMLNTAGSYVQRFSQVLGGRVVRVPVGVAGYLSSVGQPTVGAGAFSTGSARANEALSEDLNNRIAAFQRNAAVTGSVKVFAPALARFAPSWTSGVDGSFRGFMWENVDEYPERRQPRGLGAITSIGERRRIQDRIVDRRFGKLSYQAQIDAKVLELTEDGGTLQDIAERVSFAKSNFGMVMNAKAFVQDPVGVGKAVVGITASNETLARSLAKRGIMVAPGQVEAFIGTGALKTFRQTADGLAAAGQSIGSGLEAEAASIGQSYEQAAYKLGSELGTNDRGYEDTYGDHDYSGLVQTTPSAREALNEASGDSDAAPGGSEVSPDTFRVVYPGTTTQTTPSVEAQASAARNAQSSTPTGTADDTSGIRGVEDDDATIDPVV